MAPARFCPVSRQRFQQALKPGSRKVAGLHGAASGLQPWGRFLFRSAEYREAPK
jgi:hypothetical protein